MKKYPKDTIKNLQVDKNEKEIESALNYKCACGCGAQIQVQKAGNGQIMIDTRIDGRHRWVGVVLDLDRSHNISRFLKP